VKYAIIVMFVLGFLCGGYISHKFFARTTVSTVVGPGTVKEVVRTKEVIKQADGTVVERIVVQTKDKVKPSPQQPKPEYRLGALLPIASEIRLPTVTASKRLFGSVWLDSQIDIRHKEVLLGISIEF